MTSPMNLETMSWDLKKGTWYEVSYRRQLGNYQWVTEKMTAQFLGLDKPRQELIFNLRPLAGTTQLSVLNNPILLVKVADKKQPQLPSKV